MLILYARKEEAVQVTNITSYTLHQSEVKTTLNTLHQSKLVNAWKAFILNVFRCIEYLRRRGNQS